MMRYLNHYNDAAHQSFANVMREEADCPWVVTYDDVPRIRELYVTEQIFPFNLRYSAHQSSTKGNEVLIAPEGVAVPAESLARVGGGKN
jgi:DNA adenine methylase